MEDMLVAKKRFSLGKLLSVVPSKPTDSWWNRFENLLATLVAYMILGITGLVVVDVFMRYFFTNPLNITTVVTEIVMTMVVAFGGPWLYRENGWVKIDLVTCKLKPKPQALLAAIANFLGSLFMLIIACGAWQKTYELIVTKATIINSGGDLPHAVWAIPMNLFYFVMVGVCLLKGLENLERYRAFKAGLPDPHPEDQESHDVS